MEHKRGKHSFHSFFFIFFCLIESIKKNSSKNVHTKEIKCESRNSIQMFENPFKSSWVSLSSKSHHYHLSSSPSWSLYMHLNSFSKQNLETKIIIYFLLKKKNEEKYIIFEQILKLYNYYDIIIIQQQPPRKNVTELK